MLGLITALGAFGIDAYLPAFPDIARGLNVPEAAVQYSLVSYFVALAGGQLVYGPLSDRHGRRGPLLVGFALFVAGSVWAAFAGSVEVLVAARFLQGMGACAGMVIARAVVRDLRSGEEAARLFALMILVLGVSPILAPMCGSLLLAWFDWRAVFWLLAGLGAACLAMVLLCLEETHPPAKRSAGVGEAFARYARLARDWRFVGTALVGGFSQGAVFAYLAGSSYVYITLHHVRPTAYSLLFALNAVALIGSAQGNVRLMRRLGAPRVLRAGTLLQTAAGGTLFAVAALHADTVPALAGLLVVTLGCQGILGPTSSVVALEPHAASAGAASALMGALQFGCGVVSSAAVSTLSNRFVGSAVPMAAVIAGCAAAGLLLVFFGPAGRREPGAEAGIDQPNPAIATP
ncbi:MAG TPA: multidrug effflux MFS transporter [Humisphaera sp.]